MAKLLPLILLIVGLGGGYGAGLLVKPAPVAEEAHCAEGEECPADAADGPEAHADAGDGGEAGHGDAGGDGHGEGHDTEDGLDDGHGDEGGVKEYVKLANQFIVPVIEGGRARSLVVLSLSYEVAEGTSGALYSIEPRLRDATLKVLFDHANSGGFDGRYTESRRLDALRRALLETARSIAGASVKDVLITDIMRQES